MWEHINVRRYHVKQTHQVVERKKSIPFFSLLFFFANVAFSYSICLRLGVLRSIDDSFLSKKIGSTSRLWLASMRLESSERFEKLKKGTSSTKSRNANQPERNNNFNAGPKSDKIVKDYKCTEVTQ